MVALLASVEAEKSGVEAIFQTMKPYMFHTTVLARQLWTTITGDHARFSPLSESAVLQFLSALSTVHALLSKLLTRVDAALQVTTTATTTVPQPRRDRAARGCVYGLIMGFVGLVLPLHRELEYRLASSDVDVGTEPGTHGYARARMRLLAAEVREMAGRAVREVARGLRHLPPVHYAPIQRATLVDCAQFALEQAEAAPVVDATHAQDLITIASQLRIIAYSFDLPETTLLLAQIDRHVEGMMIFNSAGMSTDVAGGFLFEHPWTEPGLA
ncbi:hypothetical protein C8R45DRAFT_292810 [Mycena sanguinolenta]|nr:hypothetical protein C8R45DRAFT_292810 [Mycena sanguinolenta]